MDTIYPVSLRFPVEMERKFLDDYFTRSLVPARIGLVIGLFIYASFGIWDGLVGDETKSTLWLIRFGIGSPWLVIVFMLSFSRHFKRWMQPLMCSVMLVTGMSLLAMLAVSPAKLRADSYYPGLMLIVFYSCTFLKIRFWYAAGSVLLLLFAYQAVARDFADLSFAVLGHNLFFLGGAGSIGLVVCYAMERYIRGDFLLEHKNAALLQKLREQKEVADRANVAKSKFLAAASHDLRQPIHALMLFVAALRQEVLAPAQRQLVNRMDASIQAMESLFNALLDISKLDAGVVTPRLEAFALTSLLAKLDNDYAPVAQAKGLRFRVRASSAWVLSDPTLLERMLRNLVENAVHYTQRGGVVVGVRRRGAAVAIEVWDTGPGIPADRQADIFQEFYQLDNPERDRRKGLGLGLAIVDRLSRLVQHPVRLTSRPGRGSRFMIELPYVAPESLALASPVGDEASAQALVGGFVVVIDDEAAIRDGLEILLGSWGCLVLTAASGTEAVHKLGQAERFPDLILSDYRLRDGETGTDAIRRIVENLGRPVPAVLITGDTAPDRLREAQASGYRLLHKPVATEKLRAILIEALT